MNKYIVIFIVILISSCSNDLVYRCKNIYTGEVTGIYTGKILKKGDGIMEWGQVYIVESDTPICEIKVNTTPL